MKGGVLSSWIKEFATLVLIQTIQAFLFTIVIVLIVNTSQASADDNTKNSALGLIGIVGLASISKVEELVKKILGVSSSVTDPSMKGGMASLATGFAVANLVKNRVLSNGKKIAGGIKDKRDVKKGIKKENERYDRRLRAAGVSVPSDRGGSSSGSYAAESDSERERRQSDAMFAEREAELNRANLPSGGGVSSDRFAEENHKMNLLKIEEMKQAHDDKIDELNKKRKEANKNITSAFVEGTTAITLAPGFGALGAAKGEVDDILKAVGIGAAAGDYIGEKATSGAFYVGGKISDRKDKSNKLKKELQDYIDKQQPRNGVTHNDLKKAFKQSKKETEKRQLKSMEERKKIAADLIKNNIKNVDDM